MADPAQLFHGPQQIDYPIIDADAHVQEPPDLWQSRAPAKWKDRAPRVKHTEKGDFWLFDEGKQPEPVSFTVSAGLSYLDFHPIGLSYDRIRPGMWQPGPRLQDLDIDGIHAQVLYPSVTLKGASTYSDEPELQRFCVRAYNEWLSEFCQDSGGRLIPQAIIPTTGVKDAVAELEWAIAHDHRGAVISRMPTGEFDFGPEDEPFFAAASEADIPIVVHIGSFLRPMNRSQVKFSFTDLPFLGQAGAIKAGSHTLPVACDLLFSGLFDKFPDLKVVLVEANIGWIPTLLEQTDDMYLRYRFFTKAYEKMRGMPSDVFHRHFWATFMVDTVGIELRHRLNIDQIMWSTDYPHTGSDWPNSRVTIERVFKGLPKTEVKKMLHDNVKRLYKLDHIPEQLPR
jgi:predicted TIM-barrel fold metal-dependent hydrolase